MMDPAARALNYLMVALVSVWVLLVVYVGFLALRLRKAERELDRHDDEG